MSKNNTTSTVASSPRTASKTTFAKADSKTRQKAETLAQKTLQIYSEVTELRSEINSMTHSDQRALKSFLASSKHSTRQAKRVFVRVLKRLSGDYSKISKRHLTLTAFPAWILLALATFLTPLLFQTSQMPREGTAGLAMSPQFLEMNYKQLIDLQKNKNFLKEELVRAAKMINNERAELRKLNTGMTQINSQLNAVQNRNQQLEVTLSSWTDFEKKYLRETANKDMVIHTTDGWKYLHEYPQEK